MSIDIKAAALAAIVLGCIILAASFDSEAAEPESSDGATVLPEESSSEVVAYVGEEPFSDFQKAVDYAKTNGGAVRVCKTVNVESDMSVSDVTIGGYGDFAEAFFSVSDRAKLELSYVTIDGSSESGTYAVSLGSSSSLVMTGSKISNNAAGAIYASGATVNISSTDFHNSGLSASSALYFNNSTVELSGVTIQGCSGRISPVFIQDSDVTVNDSRIIGNTSNTGVGIFIENNSDHTVTMKDNTAITENAGAGIYAYSANGHLTLNLEGVTIRDNTATDNRSGGVIAYAIDSGHLTLDLDGVTIKENGTSDACSVIVEFESSTSIPEVVLSGSAT